MFLFLPDTKLFSYTLDYLKCENVTSFRKFNILTNFIIIIIFFFKVQKPFYNIVLMFERVSDPKSSFYTLGFIKCENGTYFRKLNKLTKFLLIFLRFKSFYRARF